MLNMGEFFSWNQSDTVPCCTLVCISGCFIIYWFLSNSKKLKNYFFSTMSAAKRAIAYFSFQKLSGGFLLGVLPGLSLFLLTDYSFALLGVQLGDIKQSLLHISWMLPLILTLTFFATKKTPEYGHYPQLKIAEWNLQLILLNSFLWAIYIFAYELMFRGVLLTVCKDYFGLWPSIAINATYYSITHIPKGAGETAGAFFFGILLCIITVSTQSILAAVTAHLVLALSNDFFSVYHHPKMKFIL
jgi:membrane protease YdiL (CAAX protease family)